jgi:5,10-methylenetetrahydromethanopterin reductase
MDDLPRMGIRLHGGLSPHACVRLAAIAEANGLGSVWFAENPFARGALPAASATAVATRRIRLGVGAVNPYSRHPALIAMEFGALDELAQGRTRLGIGAGIGAAIDRMGFRNERPLSALRDAIHIVRALLRGEELTYAGRVFSATGIKLGCPPRPSLPIYMAAMGEQSLRLCGQLADGLIVSNLCPSAFTEHAAAILRTAAAAAGRPGIEVVQYVPCVPRPERGEARRAVKLAIGEMLVAFWPANGAWPAAREAIVRHSGIPRDDFAAALARLRAGEAAPEVLDDRFVDAFAIAGTAEECLARAVDYGRAGASELALTFAGPQPETDIEYLGDALGRQRPG